MKGLRSWATQPGLMLALIVTAVIVLWAIFPGLFTDKDPLLGVPTEALSPPSLRAPFGTDQLGRDQFSRVVHGARLSLITSLLAVVLATIFGATVGILAGYLRGKFDTVISGVLDVLLAIPTVLLSLAVVTVSGFGAANVALAIAVGMVARMARVARAESMRTSSATYVEAATLSGVSTPGVLIRHVVPNAAGPILVLSTLELGTVVLQVAALSFLGFGAQPPTPEWGALIASGRNYLVSSWWLSGIPGLTIIALVLSVNRIAHALGNRREISV